jgi:hypothetical protein
MSIRTVAGQNRAQVSKVPLERKPSKATTSHQSHASRLDVVLAAGVTAAKQRSATPVGVDWNDMDPATRPPVPAQWGLQFELRHMDTRQEDKNVILFVRPHAMQRPPPPPDFSDSGNFYFKDAQKTLWQSGGKQRWMDAKMRGKVDPYWRLFVYGDHDRLKDALTARLRILQRDGRAAWVARGTPDNGTDGTYMYSSVPYAWIVDDSPDQEPYIRVDLRISHTGQRGKYGASYDWPFTEATVNALWTNLVRPAVDEWMSNPRSYTESMIAQYDLGGPPFRDVIPNSLNRTLDYEGPLPTFYSPFALWGNPLPAPELRSVMWRVWKVPSLLGRAMHTPLTNVDVTEEDL